MKWFKRIGKRRYCKITLKTDKGKGGFTCEPHEVNELMFYENDGDFDITDVWMRPKEYMKLPEFEGF